MAKTQNKTEKEVDKLELSPEEMKIIALNRAKEANANKCREELGALLNKYNMILKVDGRSPLNNPQLMLVPKE